MPHKEQVYKIYAIDKWFFSEIRCSVPDSLMRSAEVVQFDHHVKWKPEQFTEFDPTHNRLDMPMTERLISILAKELDLTFYGIDIIVDDRDGTHYIVDCNYLGKYSGIPMADLISAVDNMLRKHYSEIAIGV